MIVETRKSPTGRRIRRVQKVIFGFGYWLADPNLPTLSVSLDGQDGIQYTIAITDADLKTLNEARKRHCQEFEKYYKGI